MNNEKMLILRLFEMGGGFLRRRGTNCKLLRESPFTSSIDAFIASHFGQCACCTAQGNQVDIPAFIGAWHLKAETIISSFDFSTRLRSAGLNQSFTRKLPGCETLPSLLIRKKGEVGVDFYSLGIVK